MGGAGRDDAGGQTYTGRKVCVLYRCYAVYMLYQRIVYMHYMFSHCNSTCSSTYAFYTAITSLHVYREPDVLHSLPLLSNPLAVIFALLTRGSSPSSDSAADRAHVVEAAREWMKRLPHALQQSIYTSTLMQGLLLTER